MIESFPLVYLWCKSDGFWLHLESNTFELITWHVVTKVNSAATQLLLSPVCMGNGMMWAGSIWHKAGIWERSFSCAPNHWGVLRREVLLFTPGIAPCPCRLGRLVVLMLIWTCALAVCFYVGNTAGFQVCAISTLVAIKPIVINFSRCKS